MLAANNELFDTEECEYPKRCKTNDEGKKLKNEKWHTSSKIQSEKLGRDVKSPPLTNICMPAHSTDI